MTLLDNLRRLDQRVRGLADRLTQAEDEKKKLATRVAEQDKRLAALDAEVKRLRESRAQVKRRVDDLLGKLESMNLDAP